MGNFTFTVIIAGRRCW